MNRAERVAMVDPGRADLSVRRQCALLGLARSGVYRKPAAPNLEELSLMRWIDEQYLATPFYGSRRMTAEFRKAGRQTNRKRVQRLMRLMGLEALDPKPKTSRPSARHRVYPYLLRGLAIDRPNQVWAADITYIPMARGFLYLAVVMDWYSRYVLAWRLSNTMDTHSASMPSTTPWEKGDQRSLTPTRERNSPVRRLPTSWKPRARASAWTAAGAGWTMFSSSGCGAA